MIARSIAAELSGSSLIRQMFEKGAALKAQFGADRVYDFSLGNPDLPAPDAVTAALKKIAERNRHGYMPNAGYPSFRQKIAQDESERSGLDIQPNGVVATVGAAGALCVSLRALLDEGDEVLILAPCFPEYLTYVRHCGGKPVVLQPQPGSLLPDLDKIAAALTPRTKALILNSPNNPSGRVVPETLLTTLDGLLLEAPNPVYVLADEPYAEIVFDGRHTPSPLRYLHNCLRIYSWSKAYALPGERIGYVAVRPGCADYERLISALIFLNRSLGFVNAPAIWQQVIVETDHLACPVAAYETRVEALRQVLETAGIPCAKPEGSFYLFPKTPLSDDRAFCEHLSRYNILVVPGSAFWLPGYMRLSSCVPEATIAASAAAFSAAMKTIGECGI